MQASYIPESFACLNNKWRAILRVVLIATVFLASSSVWAQVGTIQIILDSRPNVATNFSFSTTIPPGANFTLDDDANAALPNTITFNAVPAGSYSVTQNTTSPARVFYSLSCTGDVDNGSTINLATRSVTIDLDSGEAIVCRFVNAQLPTLVLRKVSRIATGTFNFNVTNADTNLATAGSQSSAAIVTIAAGAALTYDANPALPGTQNIDVLSYSAPIVVTELQTVGFALQSVAGTTCTVSNGTATVVRNITNDGTTAGTISISNLVPADTARMQFVCLFDNGTLADLTVSIDDAVTSVGSGAQSVYVITATNNGPGVANGALLSVPAVIGLNCSAGPISCSATGGAVCPVGLTVGQLQTGVAIPTLPIGGALTVSVNCSVTATGF